jgi:hypothetical protein
MPQATEHVHYLAAILGYPVRRLVLDRKVDRRLLSELSRSICEKYYVFAVTRDWQAEPAMEVVDVNEVNTDDR